MAMEPALRSSTTCFGGVPWAAVLGLLAWGDIQVDESSSSPCKIPQKYLAELLTCGAYRRRRASQCSKRSCKPKGNRERRSRGSARARLGRTKQRRRRNRRLLRQNTYLAVSSTMRQIRSVSTRLKREEFESKTLTPRTSMERRKLFHIRRRENRAKGLRSLPPIVRRYLYLRRLDVVYIPLAWMKESQWDQFDPVRFRYVWTLLPPVVDAGYVETNIDASLTLTDLIRNPYENISSSENSSGYIPRVANEFAIIGGRKVWRAMSLCICGQDYLFYGGRWLPQPKGDLDSWTIQRLSKEECWALANRGFVPSNAVPRTGQRVSGFGLRSKFLDRLRSDRLIKGRRMNRKQSYVRHLKNKSYGFMVLSWEKRDALRKLRRERSAARRVRIAEAKTAKFYATADRFGMDYAVRELNEPDVESWAYRYRALYGRNP
jgi:hypothetical protein